MSESEMTCWCIFNLTKTSSEQKISSVLFILKEVTTHVAMMVTTESTRASLVILVNTDSTDLMLVVNILSY